MCTPAPERPVTRKSVPRCQAHDSSVGPSDDERTLNVPHATDEKENTMSQLTTEPSPRSVTPFDDDRSPAPSKAALWTGRVVSALPILALGMSGVMKFMPPNQQMTEGFEPLGWPPPPPPPLGAPEPACIVPYATPRTAVLGAILVTGYMGGAIATHLRVGDPF